MNKKTPQKAAGRVTPQASSFHVGGPASLSPQDNTLFYPGEPSPLAQGHGNTLPHRHSCSCSQDTLPYNSASTPSSASYWLRKIFTWPIKFYQIVFSGAPRVCRFEPTCSQYAIEAIERYGIFKGTAKALWRILRCNPWTPGGYDPVR